LKKLKIKWKIFLFFVETNNCFVYNGLELEIEIYCNSNLENIDKFYR
jgi:hypothetical protein